jgi:hypothetical protein
MDPQAKVRGPQAEDFIDHFADNAVLLHDAQRSLFLFHQLRHRSAHLGPHTVARNARKDLQVDPVQQFTVKNKLQVLILAIENLLRKEAPDPARFLTDQRLCIWFHVRNS